MLLVFRQGFQLILQKKRALCQPAISTLLKAGLQCRFVGCQNDLVQCRTMMPCKRLYLGQFVFYDIINDHVRTQRKGTVRSGQDAFPVEMKNFGPGGTIGTFRGNEARLKIVPVDEVSGAVMLFRKGSGNRGLSAAAGPGE